LLFNKKYRNTGRYERLRMSQPSGYLISSLFRRDPDAGGVLRALNPAERPDIANRRYATAAGLRCAPLMAEVSYLDDYESELRRRHAIVVAFLHHFKVATTMPARRRVPEPFAADTKWLMQRAADMRRIRELGEEPCSDEMIERELLEIAKNCPCDPPLSAEVIRAIAVGALARQNLQH
jgi:hypothetical protein